MNDGENETLVFVEAKVRTVRDRRVVLQAARQAIADSQNEFASIIAFVVRHLHSHIGTGTLNHATDFRCNLCFNYLQTIPEL